MDKYYTPDISDLYIGYECESLCSEFLSGFDWQKCIISKESFKYLDNVGIYRTLHLSKENVESLGWVWETNDMGFPEYYKKGDYNMYPRKDGFYEIKKMDFKNPDEYARMHPTYIGKIKSINELKTIIKLLGIK